MRYIPDPDELPILPVRNEKKETDFRNLVRSQTTIVLNIVMNVMGHIPRELPDSLCTTFEQLQLLHPSVRASCIQAAIHETCHFVAIEALGLGAMSAVIRGTRGRGNDWGGTTSAMPPCPSTNFREGDRLLADAVCDLAGPLGEAILESGPLAASMGEITGARFRCAVKALDEGGDATDEFRAVFHHTADLIITLGMAIDELAEKLARRHLLKAREERKLLEFVRQHPVVTGASSRHSIDLLFNSVLRMTVDPREILKHMPEYEAWD